MHFKSQECRYMFSKYLFFHVGHILVLYLHCGAVHTYMPTGPPGFVSFYPLSGLSLYTIREKGIARRNFLLLRGTYIQYRVLMIIPYCHLAMTLFTVRFGVHDRVNRCRSASQSGPSQQAIPIPPKQNHHPQHLKFLF
jgi:hypothetical protein